MGRQLRMSRTEPRLALGSLRGGREFSRSYSKDEMSSRAQSLVEESTAVVPGRQRFMTEEASQLSFLQDRPPLPSNYPGRMAEKAKLSLNLDAARRMNHEFVLGRLQTQLKSFHEKSFKTYAKNHDMYTGQKKLRMDPQKLRHQELDYVQDLQSLVGSSSEVALRFPR